MRRKRGFALAMGVLLLGLAWAGPGAGEEPAGTIARVSFFRAQPGMEKQLEEGLKRHMSWYRGQRDPWAWLIFQVVSGENSGGYVGGAFGRQWKDFDAPPVSGEEDSADSQANVRPYTEGSVVQFYEVLPAVSRPAQGEGTGAPSLYEEIAFELHYGKSADFLYVIGKFHQAIEKTGWPESGKPAQYEWYELANGGPAPTFVLVLPRRNWAEFKPLEKPFERMLEEAFGRQEAQALLETFSRAVKSAHSSILRARPELSYIPGAE